MRRALRLRVALLALPFLSIALLAQNTAPTVDMAIVAKIRAEGLQRSQVMETESYIADVLGARLTLSDDMKRAQTWAAAEMKRIGLVNVAIEPFMDFGTTWDNEYTSLHMLTPDYQPMVGYPIAHTPGTNGKQTVSAIVAEIRTKADLETFRGKLAGMAVLMSAPATVDLKKIETGTPRYTDEEVKKINDAVPPVPAVPAPPGAPNPNNVTALERMRFYKSEGVAVVLQCDSGWMGAVRGFSRPGSGADKWSREETLASPAIVAINPEHYNRMYRILKRGIPVTVEVDVRNKIGATVEKANNVIGEILGGDLKDEVVMIGAHFDTWHASPNASDNTSGTSVMLEAMRILKAVGANPRRTIRLALWAGEEQGLHGSTQYVLKHFGDPNSPQGVTAEFNKLSAYFNQDYGPGQYRGIYLQGNEAARAMMTAWTAPFKDLGMTAVSILGVGSTDHISFDRVGLPGFQFLQDRVGGTGGHTNLDFIETIPADDMKKNATIVAAFAYNAAMADTKVPRKR